ncbi:uncharacterized protein BO87DRAFT_392638 [Aspergillus neoniger CBS 115656]|uniref:Uncharacterized protein n=1 Tax=Aspergillus neoniger (strain CBS 115656) TaxID=1448310 RepID=A0A318YVR8_ASPNB|nr:hypothetical protein BO87DRAFT_392638 [Aspergillus neoniger CBS 115656]PYH38951.1 hypothetical protein BO87DRAFT_392638 [Aspergillus neoniger CBS 115656]
MVQSQLISFRLIVNHHWSEMPAHPPGGCLPVGQLAPLFRGRREGPDQTPESFFSRRRRLMVASAALAGCAKLLQHSREQTATRQWTTASRRGSHWKSVSSGPSQFLVYCRYRIQGCSTLVHAVAPKTHSSLSPQPASQTEYQPGGFPLIGRRSEIKTIYRQIM